ncbi:M60 family metallopeptidase [Niabella hirudinis]|uniref:M60 family metallopeptidase n=1 Tax=Niabella hirudinis TaxID=1285929 RepID=UPI003EB80816
MKLVIVILGGLILLPVLIFISTTLSAQSTSDQQRLLSGVGTIPLTPDKVRTLATYPLNYDAQVIAYRNLYHDSTQLLYAPVIITGRYGKGKVLVIGSNQYLKSNYIKNLNVLQLWKNIITWAVDSVGRICFEDTSFQRVADIAAEINAPSFFLSQDEKLPKAQAFFVTKEPIDTAHIQMLDDFVLNGGTLVYASSLWDRVLLLNSMSISTNFNSLLAKAGLYHKVDRIYGRSADSTMLTKSIPKYLIVDSVISSLSSQTYKKDFFRKGAEIVPLTILKLIYLEGPKNSKAYTDLYNAINNATIQYQPTASLRNPLPTNQWPSLLKYLDRLRKDNNAAIPDILYKASTNADFPGVVPDEASRETQDVTINFFNKWSGLFEVDTSFKRWHSTGLYVAPGDNVRIVLKNIKDTARKIVAQIGAHEDDVSNWVDEYYRNPLSLVKTFDLKKDTTLIYSPYGGLLYFDIPVADTGSVFTANVIGAVNAPYFKLGQTSNKEWIKSIRNYPAPWAELATDKIILTVPADSIRNLNNPESLMRFWDEIMDANAELAQLPKQRAHPERIIVDNNVKFGYMWTLPKRIMVPNDESLSLMLNETELRTKGSWGHFHEIGHRHQFFGIDFRELTEVSVNLYTLYAFHKVLKKELYQSREGRTRKSIQDGIRKYIQNPDYETLRSDPLMLLITLYYPIIESFGWEPIKKLNAGFRTIYNEQYKGVSRSRLDKISNDEKRDHYFVALSKAVGKNLGAYFDNLRIPVSETARNEVQNLPGWLPEIFK